MANYVLWGKDPDGRNADQKKEIQLPRRNSTWSQKEVESIEGLLEDPSFSETSFFQLGVLPSKISTQPFSREELREKLSEKELLPFENLWKEIDRIELKINWFELERGKRKKPPRNELLQRFSEEEICTLRESAKRINHFQYLKLRHLLVELRREQYTWRDAVLPQVFPSHQLAPSAQSEPLSLEVDVPILPLGPFNGKIFRPFEKLVPGNFSEDDLREISTLIWKKKEEEARAPLSFDFRKLENVYQFLLHFSQLVEEEQKDLLNTFFYYREQANLTVIQEKVLEMKLRQKRNQEIAEAINKEFGKKYTDNYISTIFRQKVIPAINSAAQYHEKVVGNLFFEEEFKVCASCGKLLLRDPENFVRRARAKDGLSNRCKKCDKEAREKNKQVIEIKRIERFQRQLLQLEPIEFLGVTKILGVQLIREEEPLAFEEVFPLLMEKYSSLNRRQRKNLHKMLRPLEEQNND